MSGLKPCSLKTLGPLGQRFTTKKKFKAGTGSKDRRKVLLKSATSYCPVTEHSNDPKFSDR